MFDNANKIFMKYLVSLLLILFFCVQSVSFAQQTESWLDKNEPTPYAKLYLHTDRDFYFLDDSVWFKAYYLDGQSQQMLAGLFNMYADLIDEDGDIIYSEVLPITNGVSSGYLPIPRSVKEGNYMIRAFTDFQKVYGEDAFFYKTINISAVKNSLEIETRDSILVYQQTTKPDIAFLPEGGFLLAGQQNIVGVNAIDQSGKGISIRGMIFNSKDEFVTFFTTKYKGMGMLFFTPEPEETYKAKIDGYPAITFNLPNIVEEGIKLGIIRESNEELFFNIASNSIRFENKNYFFAILNKGKVLFYQAFSPKEKNTQIKINLSDLPAGINRAVLLNAQMKPISERLFFSRNFDVNEIHISINQDEFVTRSNVQLDLREKDTTNNQSFSSLSVAVIDENAVGVNGPAFDIKSWLLLNSELKGNIETPSDFFRDDNISSKDKLNLLMLTQGWSNYLWNTIVENEDASNYKFSEGISISGRVSRLWNKKPVVDGDILVGLQKNAYFETHIAKTDSVGCFSIDNIIFTDSVSVFIQAKNGNNKQSLELILNPLFEEQPGISLMNLQSIRNFNALPAKLSRQKYYSDLAMKAFSPEEGAIMLDEVIVKAQKIEKDDVTDRFYPKPAVSLKISDSDEIYENAISYLASRVPGVRVAKGEIIIRGPSNFRGNSSPLFLLNGFKVPPSVIKDTPMTDIMRIEVYKNANETAMFGMQGSNGVISVYTKQWSDIEIKESENHGIISSTLMGYEAYREFYTPKYNSQNIKAERPDNRITLYWNPNVLTQNGKANLSFFTSDDISNFKVFVEGITNDGRVCLGTAGFSVNEYNQELLK